jgi:hypothetical protein
MVINPLQELIAPYQYGQFNLLEDEMQITVNSRTKQVKLAPFYRYDTSLNFGSCGELMNSAYRAIRRELPYLHVTRVIGNDPSFFRKSLDTHCFLFVSEQDLLRGNLFTEDKKEIEFAISKNPLIVDPSFQRVVPFSESGYSVQNLINQGCPVEYSQETILKDKGAVPLCKDSSDRIFYLGVNFNSENLINFFIQESGGDLRPYPVNSPCPEENVKRFLGLLNGKKMERVLFGFSTKPHVVIQ